jgi:hypothetical protein
MKQLAFAIALTTVSLAQSVSAEDTDLARSQGAASLARGVEKSEVALLKRAAGADHSSKLVSRLCADCKPETTSDGFATVASTKASLRLGEKGTFGEYKNRSFRLETARRVDPGAKRDQVALDKLGRGVLQNQLADVVTLAADEQIVPIAIHHVRVGGSNSEGGARTEEVIASQITYGRLKQGLPVIGGGSTVKLRFNNDGELVYLRYDWPSYQATGKKQKTAPQAEVLARVNNVVGARSGRRASALTAAAPALGAARFPFALSADASMHDYRCGYLDSGFGAASTRDELQPACEYHVVAKGADGVEQALAGAVPAGSDFATSVNWPESQVLRGQAVPVVDAPADPGK